MLMADVLLCFLGGKINEWFYTVRYCCAVISARDKFKEKFLHSKLDLLFNDRTYINCCPQQLFLYKPDDKFTFR